MMIRTTRLLVALALGVAASAAAQDEAVGIVAGPEDPGGMFTMPLPPPGGMWMGDGPEAPEIEEDVVVLFAHDGGETRLVKGAPYQAEAVTEITQRLADGNRIVRKTVSSVARDSEGRTRREGGLAALGPFPAGHKPSRHVFLHDPVAGVAYVLEPDEKVARKLPKPGDLHAGRRHRLPPPMPGGGNMMFERRIEKRMPKGEAESLGTQSMDGVEVEGTRRTTTIPAGEIGNEKPIVIVAERWYSKELQTVVMSRHDDPRMGETTYKLTHLTRGEPDRALFEVPSDYTIKEGPPGRHLRHKAIEEKP